MGVVDPSETKKKLISGGDTLASDLEQTGTAALACGIFLPLQDVGICPTNGDFQIDRKDLEEIHPLIVLRSRANEGLANGHLNSAMEAERPGRESDGTSSAKFVCTKRCVKAPQTKYRKQDGSAQQ